MKKLFSILFLILTFSLLGYFFLPKKVNPIKNGQIVLRPAKITNYQTVHTKLVSDKTYPIYQNVSSKGGVNATSSTKYFRTSLLQSQRSAKTKNGTYWQLVINGREAGWVNEKCFLRNKISVAKHISLVRNNYYAFPVNTEQ